MTPLCSKTSRGMADLEMMKNLLRYNQEQTNEQTKKKRNLLLLLQFPVKLDLVPKKLYCFVTAVARMAFGFHSFIGSH